MGGGERKVADKSTEAPADKSTASSDSLFNRTFFDKSLNELNKDKPADKPAGDKPADGAGDKPVDKPAEVKAGPEADLPARDWKTLDPADPARKAVQDQIGPTLKTFKDAGDDVQASQAKIFKDAVSKDANNLPVVDRTVEGKYKDAAGAEKTGAFTQKFTPDGKVTLGLPQGHELGEKLNVGSITFNKDGTVGSVTGKDGKPRELNAQDKTALEAALKQPGALQISGKGEKGTEYNYDLKSGTTDVKSGLPKDGSLKLFAPNNAGGLDSSAEVKSADGKAGFTLQASGDRRFLDYKDGEGTKPTDKDGNTIEGIRWTKDREVMVNTSKDASIESRKLNVDGSIETKFKDNKDGKVREIQAADKDQNQVLTEYDPAKSKNGLFKELSIESRNPENPGSFNQTIRKLPASEGGNGYEATINIRGPQTDTTGKLFYKDEAALAGDKPSSKLAIDNRTGNATLTLPEKAGKDEAGIIEYTAGQATPKLSKLTADGKQGAAVTNADEIAKYTRTPEKPPVAVNEEKTADGKKTTYADGVTVTRDDKLGATTTEAPGGKQTKFDKPLTADSGPIAGFPKGDKRLDGVNKITETKGPNGETTYKLEYEKPVNGKTFEAETRDASGKPISTMRDGSDPTKGHYVEKIDPKTDTITRAYDSKDGRPQEIEVSKASNPSEKLYSREVGADGKVTTRDYLKKTVEVREGNKYTLSDDKGNLLSSGSYKEIADGPNKGRQLIDDRTGMVMGMEFTEGPRKGQSYSFSRDAEGSITKIDMSVPGKDGTTQRVTVEKGADGKWNTNPPNSDIPGFKNLQRNSDGSIAGTFKANTNGDITYENPDKSLTTTVRANGNIDTFNMKDYSRVREFPDGTSKKTHWDGYEWREGGQVQDLGDGKVKVTFPPAEGKPTEMIRDAKSNGFQTTFGDKSVFTVNDWNQGKLTYTPKGDGTKTANYYNTGTTGDDGKVNWRKGVEAPGKDGRMQVTFSDPADQKAIQEGKIPATSEIDPKTGEIISTFANGTSITADQAGKYKKINHGGGRSTELLYDQNGKFRGYKQQPGGTEILQGKDLPAGPNGEKNAEWTIRRPGQPESKINGTLNPIGPGAFEIADGKGNLFRSEASGRQIEMANGVVTRAVDGRGQEYKLKTPAKEGGKPTYEVNGKEMPAGDIKFFENGNVGIQVGEQIQMQNPDKSVSMLDKTGQEVSRKFEDGSSYKRNPDGSLAETVDKDGNKTTFSPKEVDTPAGKKTILEANKYNKEGKLVGAERIIDGRLKSVQLDGDKVKEPPTAIDAKTAIMYDPATGSRRELNETTKQVTVTDLHGKKTVMEFNNLDDPLPAKVLDGNNGNKVLAQGDGKTPAYKSPEGKDVRLNPVTGAVEAADASAADAAARQAKENLDPALAKQKDVTAEVTKPAVLNKPGDKPAEVKPGDVPAKPGAGTDTALSLLGIPPEGRAKALEAMAKLGVDVKGLENLGNIMNQTNLGDPKFLAAAKVKLEAAIKAGLKQQKMDGPMEQLYGMLMPDVQPPKKFADMSFADMVTMGQKAAENPTMAEAFKTQFGEKLNKHIGETTAVLSSLANAKEGVGREQLDLKAKEQAAKAKAGGPDAAVAQALTEFYALLRDNFKKPKNA